MFYYSLHGFEENTILLHNKKFTQEEFIGICNEAPRWSEEYYSSIGIEEYLITHYGFKKPELSASLFVDGAIIKL